ncbi:MAG: hypothetical protein ABIT82_07785 [Ramlibacter sp.]
MRAKPDCTAPGASRGAASWPSCINENVGARTIANAVTLALASAVLAMKLR